MVKIAYPAPRIAGENNLVSPRDATVVVTVMDRILYPVPMPYVRLAVLPALISLRFRPVVETLNVKELKIALIAK